MTSNKLEKLLRLVG